MKNFCLLFVLLLSLTMSGCGKSQDTTVFDATSGNKSVTYEQDNQINSEITQEKAAVLLNDYLQTIGISKDNDPNLVITMDHTDKAEGQEYYVFQVFDDMNCECQRISLPLADEFVCHTASQIVCQLS